MHIDQQVTNGQQQNKEGLGKLDQDKGWEETFDGIHGNT